jgi:hypothetical protein
MVISEAELAEPFLTTVAQAGVTDGVATDEQADRWLREQRERGETGRMLLVVPLLATVAVRPPK